MAAFIAGAITPTALIPSEPRDLRAVLNVTPLRLDLDSRSQFRTFQVRNETNEPVPVQARAFAWTQQSGREVYTPASTIAISPSIIEIPPHTTQFFKLMRYDKATVPVEESFRLVIDQLPTSRHDGTVASVTLLRFSVPVFVNGDVARLAKLNWKTQGARVTVTNTGGRAARLSRMSLVTLAGGARPMSIKGPQYILPGASVNLPLPGDVSCVPDGSIVTGSLDNAPFSEPIPHSCG